MTGQFLLENCNDLVLQYLNLYTDARNESNCYHTIIQ